jgi:hypothetical protein
LLSLPTQTIPLVQNVPLLIRWFNSSHP